MSEVNDPNYPVIELEAKLELTKDKIIKLLEDKIVELQLQLAAMTQKVPVSEFEVPVEGLVTPITRPRIRTMSEAALLLEKRSLNSVSLKEEPKNA